MGFSLSVAIVILTDNLSYSRPVVKIRIQSLSASKKTPRQLFMSALMKRVSGAAGEDIATAFSKGQADKLKVMLDELSDGLVKASKKNR